MKKFGFVLFLFIAIGSFSTTAFAGTLTLESTGGQVVNGEYIYPYNFSVDGSSTLTPLLCLDFNRLIQQGETWNVTKNSIPTDNSPTSVDYRAVALISAAIQAHANNISTSDYQFAAWSIFDPADMAINSGFTATAQTIAATALADAADPSLTPHFDYSAFFFYAPTSDKTGWTHDIPQEFIGSSSYNPNFTPRLAPRVPSPVPEPSGLMLFGTGLVGVATLIRRRLVQA